MINLNDYKNYLLRKESADSTIKGYLGDLKQLNEFAKVNHHEALSFELMRDYKRYMISVMNYKTSTINHKIIVFSTFFNYLEKVNTSIRASDYKVKRVNVQNSNGREYLVEDEYNSLLMVCHHPETRMLMKLIARTGLRISEALALTKESISPIEILITNKGKTRVIGMSDDLKDELREFFIQRGETERMFSFSQTTYRNHMKKAARVCEVKEDKVYPHAFRHYFAKSFLKNSKDERALSMLQAILGHSDIKTTMLYLQFNNSELAEIMMV
ncbi:tyrosine-type recombinase/integrase [Vagococcus salmoninarum]|uniref:Integrase n=1 Tax=Vagococcus salmoninarum TaxID=2739 RepID=A0A429ZSC0_9ENTE|nr:site-specific integrase [Vagococcus salmoninarum]RST96634.1 hypothetical protein CBF35_05220 [Vagococcus salmoninarum]